MSIQGKRTLHGPVSVEIKVRPQDITVREAVPTRYALYQNHPNPFNPLPAIAYDLPDVSEVTLVIYALNGQEVATLVSFSQEAEHYEVVWDGSGCGDGVYIYHLEASSFVQTRKMVKIE